MPRDKAGITSSLNKILCTLFGCGCAGAPPAKFVRHAFAFDLTVKQRSTYKDLCTYPLHIRYQSWNPCSDVTNSYTVSQATGPRRRGYAESARMRSEGLGLSFRLSVCYHVFCHYAQQGGQKRYQRVQYHTGLIL